MHDDIAPREAFRAAPLERTIGRVPRKEKGPRGPRALFALARSVDASPLRAPLVRRPRPALIPRRPPSTTACRTPRCPRPRPPGGGTADASERPPKSSEHQQRPPRARRRRPTTGRTRPPTAPGVLQRAPRQAPPPAGPRARRTPAVAIITLAVINPTVNLTRWILSSGRGHPLPIAARQYREALRQRVSRRRLALGHLRPLLRRRRARRGRVAGRR